MKLNNKSGLRSNVFSIKSNINLVIIICSTLLFTFLFSCRKSDNLTKLNTIESGSSINENPIKNDSCDLKTYTQGGWGASPHGNNPGVYLHKKFLAAFPKGLTVGCTSKFTLTLTSAQAVTDFLPCGGPAAALKANYIDPQGLKNVFAAQLVALTLSVGFDNYDPAFAGSPLNLGNLTVKSGIFKGIKISTILMEANNALGGCSSNFSISDLVTILTAINENFDNGTTNNGILNCSNSGIIVG